MIRKKTRKKPLIEEEKKATKKETKTDYLDYHYLMGVAFDLAKNPKTKYISNYIIIATHTGLRSSDVLPLTWEDLRNKTINIIEKKTRKKKRIAICDEIHEIIKPEYTGSPFLSKKKTVVSVQHLNFVLKEIFADDIKKRDLHISTHTFRKSFGRQIFKNNKESEKSLIYLMDLFNHADLKTTRTYLGIRQEELDELYLNLSGKRK